MIQVECIAKIGKKGNEIQEQQRDKPNLIQLITQH